MSSSEPEQSPIVDYSNTNPKESKGGNSSASSTTNAGYGYLIYYTIIILLVIMIVYQAYCNFCGEGASFFLGETIKDDIGDNDDDEHETEYIENFIEELKTIQNRNISRM